MFLHQLSTEEKKSFLEIAYHFAWSNNDFSDAQKKVIEGYCNEMQIDNIDYNRENFDLGEVLSGITNPKSQKIFLLETLALIYADGSDLDSVHRGEKAVLTTMISAFNMKENVLVLYSEWTKCMLSLATQGECLIQL